MSTRIVAALAVAMATLVVPAVIDEASIVQAAGSPDIGLAKEMPARSLYGEDIPVTLTMSNPAGPDGFNALITDILPVGVSYVGGSSSPEPLIIPRLDGTTALVWSNIADSLTGTSVVVSYSITVDTAVFDVPDTVTNSASAYVNSDARVLPAFSPVTGDVVLGTFTGNDSASAVTELIPFELTKAEPSAEDELLRGVHDHQTIYTLTIENNLVNPTNDFSVVDFIPAQLEFLGCNPITDNSTGGDEYAGSGPIVTGAVTVNPCPIPSSVTTVTLDPDGAGPLPNAVYTRVEWDSASLAAAYPSEDLAAGGVFLIDYVAAIPLFENTQAPLVVSTANLDNNNGALTTESETTVQNYAVATGFYNGAAVASTDDDYEQVVIEDVSIHKTVDAELFEQGSNPVWTLLVESSEYAVSTGTITVTDTLPATVNFDSAVPAADAPPVLNGDGTLTLTWTLPAFTTPTSTATITIDTTVRPFYRLGDNSNGSPVAANDSYTNITDLATDATIITDAAAGTTLVPVIDESSASQTSEGPNILKEVGLPGPDPLTCGDGSTVTFHPTFASSYSPGDRVCYRLRVNFPNMLDTLDPLVTDFLPSGFAYESHAFTVDSTVTAGDATFTADGSLLEWDLDNTDTGLLFEVVVQTIITDPLEGAPGDLKENLLKFRYSNLAGEVFQLRDAALAEWSEPVLDLEKGVIALNGTAVPGAPIDGVTVQEGDVVTYQIALTNTGTEPANDISVRDTLIPESVCGEVSAISNGGACDAANTWIQWDAADNIDVPAGGSTTLTYDMVVPVGVSALASLINNAGVRNFTSPTNTGTPFTYVPANNIDPTLTPNTDAADDPSDIITDVPTISKTAATSVTESGNSATTQATIGETVSYTVTTDLPEGLTYYNPVISDILDAEKDLDVASLSATINGAALPAGVVLAGDNAGNSWTLTFPATYVVSAAETVVITFDAQITDVASNTRGTSSPNTVNFDFESITGDPRNINDSAPMTIVEPDIDLDKAHNDDDGVVTAGQTLTYTLDVTNTAGGSVSVAHDTVVVDTIPAELIVDVGSISAGGVWAAGPRTITWTITALNPGATTALTYNVTTADPLIASGSMVNNADADTTSMPGTVPGERTSASPNGDAVGDGYTDPASATVTAPVLTVAKSGSPATATVGETITYTLDVTIPGGVIAFDVTVIDDIPVGLTYESLTSITCDEGGGVCSPDLTTGDATVIEDGDVVAFFFDDLTTAATGDRVVTITYVAYVADVGAADDGATLTNGAAIHWNASDTIATPPATPPTPGSFDDSSPTVTDDVDTTEPTLTIDKDVAGQVGDTDTRRANAGDVLTYSVTITNTGTSDAHNVTVSDVVADATWAFVDTTAAAGVTNTDSDPVGGLEWTIDGPIAPAGSVTITYTLTVPLTFDSGDEIAVGPEQTNTADVPSYFGVDEATRTANPTRTFREYDDVTADVVTIELDLASIGDDVWLDVNNDGIQQASEPVLANVDVTVTYLGPDGVLGGGDDEIFSTFTDAAGKYVVTDLPGGEYIVDVDEADPDFPAGLTASYDLDGTTVTPNGISVATLGEDEDKRDVDFGYTGTGSIGDTIWLDQDLDGVQDAGEDGIGGVDVTVTWFGPDGVAGGGDDVVYTTTTAADGTYLVENLPAGEYSVVVDTADIPTDYANVSDPDAGNDSMSTLTLGAGADDLDQDFGYAGAGSIGDTIYLDQNGDGDQDVGEPGLAGVTVELVHFGPDGVAGGGDDSNFTTVTGPGGAYLFENLPQGNYEVTVTGGITLVDNTDDPDLPGAPDAGDSVSTTTLTAAVPDDLDQDFGYHADSVLGDRVWWDLNGDGVQDPGEPGIEGVEVQITSGAFTMTTFTDANGDYLFENIPDDTYTVTVIGGVDPGFDQTFDATGSQTDETSTSVLVDADLGQDFGYNGSGSIGDTIWLDTDGDGTINPGELGIEGVEVVLTWFGADGVAGGGDDLVLTTTTDSSGNYLFDNLPAGNFSVDVTTSTLPSGLGATYDKDGGTASPNSSTPVTLATGEDVDDVDFGYNGSGSIGDTVWFDRNGDGVFDADEYPLGGVDVELVWVDAPGGAQTFTTTTAADGTYIFPNLPPGDYTVTVDTATLPPGFSETFDADAGDDSTSALTLADGEQNTSQDFGYNGAASIGDTIYLDLDGNGTQDPGEPGVPNQTVELSWVGPSGPVTFTTTTDSNGNYLFDNLPDGDFTVTVIDGIVNNAANTGDPGADGDSTNSLSIAGGVDNLDQDFGYQGNNGIGDQVWWDQNADGVFDGTEPGLDGVEITVVWFGPDGVAGGGDDITLPTTTTDVNGGYLFGNLPDGSFSVTVTDGLLPGRDTNTYDGDDMVVSPDGTSIVTDLGVGTPTPQVDLDQDFGYTGTGSIGDTVWLDLNGDGVVDPGEPGIPGAEVTLTWAGPDGVLGTADDVVYPPQTVGPDGAYLFENLPAGPFQIDVVNPITGLSVTADPDSGDDSTAQVTLAPGEENLDQDFGYVGTASIGDTIFLDVDGNGTQDTNEPGLAGITVTVTSGGADGIIGTADDIVIMVDTDADGHYLVEGLPAGPTTVSYDVSDLGAGLVPHSDLDGGDLTTTSVTLNDGDAIRDVDFGVVGDATITGEVWQDTNGDGVRDPEEDGIGGVTVIVTFDGPDGPVVFTVVTNPDGSWALTDIPPGEYTTSVDPTTVPDGLVPSTPIDVDATVPPGGTAATANGFVPAGSIGDSVWHDTDRNGVQGPGEAGASGITVELLDDSGTVIATTTTDTDGAYIFGDLPPGTYTVRIVTSTLPPEFSVVADPDGDNDGTNAVTLGPGEDITTVDFGIGSAADLPETGGTVGRTLMIASILLAAGWFLFGATRRRRLL